MRYMAALCVLVIACVCWPAFAQQWSAEQEEVIDRIRVCWDAWMDAVEANDGEIWVRDCRGEGATIWWSPEGAPQTDDTIRRNVGWWAKVDRGWWDIRPVAVNIFGDVAIVHFYGYWIAATADREVIVEDKRTAVFQKRDGAWHFLTEHSTPVTPEDAAPYQ